MQNNSPESLAQAEVNAPGTQPDEFARLIEQLSKQMAVSEFEFPPTAPLLGRLLSGIRRAWGNMAARWMLRYYAGQQLEYQSTLLQTLHLLHQQNQTLRAQLADSAARLNHSREELLALFNHQWTRMYELNDLNQAGQLNLLNLLNQSNESNQVNQSNLVNQSNQLSALLRDAARDRARAQLFEHDIVTLSRMVLERDAAANGVQP